VPRRPALVITVLAGLCVLASALGIPAAGGARRGEPEQEREQVRAQQADVAAHLDVMHADLDKVDRALQALDANVSTRQQLLEQSGRDLADATRTAQRAVTAVRRTSARLERLRKRMAAQAIAAYVSPPSDAVSDLLRVKDLTEESKRRMYDEIGIADDADLTDQLSGARKDLEVQRRRADRARARAAEKRAEQRLATTKVAHARADQRRIAAAIRQRIGESLAESIRLAKTDKDLSTRIALEQAALAARLAAEKAAAERAAALRADAALQLAASLRAAASQQALTAQLRADALIRAAAAQRAAAAAVAAVGRQTSGGRVPISENHVVLTPGATPRTGAGGISLATFDKITVNAAIVEPLALMIGAARADGVILTGGGYRDPSAQIALRQAHCGTSYFAIYQMPVSDCKPPTAPPGSSMHEIGLAVDFDACEDHDTPCYRWLAANAATFGFFNLRSEPWHWSINGS